MRTGIILSKSQLDRYEHGEVLPALAYAEHLERLYEGQGWVEMAIKSLWRPRWDPWREEHGTASTLHAGRWPAEYGGAVWIKVKPLPEHVWEWHSFEVEWGPWARSVEMELPESGIILLTGKAVDIDGISRVCNLTSNFSVFTLYGAWEHLEHEEVVDIRRGWRKADLDARADEFLCGPSQE